MSETYEIKSYDIPNTEGLTPDEAKQALNKIYAEAARDPKHPYRDGLSFQHKDLMAVTGKLHEIKAGGFGGLSSTERICNEALAGLVVKQNKLVAEAKIEMDKLVELGFDRDDIPDDLKEYQLDALKMQRFHAEGQYESLTPLISKELKSLKTTPDVLNLFSTFTNSTSLDPQLRKEVTEKIIKWIHSANKQRHEKKG